MANSKYRCQGCKNFYYQPPHRRIGLGGVCSDECARSAQSKPNSTTTTQPKRVDEPDAQTVAELYVRDRARCRFCGTQAKGHSALGRLHKHHVRYRSEGVDHSLENLILLCEIHHAMVHADKKRWQKVCLVYIWLVSVENRRLYLPAIDRIIRAEESYETC